MNLAMIMSPVRDGSTVSMVEVDAAAARAALADHPELRGADLEHPAVVAVLAAVLAEGWRRPAGGTLGSPHIMQETGISDEPTLPMFGICANLRPARPGPVGPW